METYVIGTAVRFLKASCLSLVPEKAPDVGKDRRMAGFSQFATPYIPRKMLVLAFCPLETLVGSTLFCFLYMPRETAAK